MILRAAWVIPVCSPPIADGFVEIDSERGCIHAVGPWLPSYDPSRARHLGHCSLLPGLVNPHTHLELSCYEGLIPPAPLWDWIAQLVQLRRAPGEREREQAGVEQGACQMLRAGITCVGDISRRNIAWRVLKRIPIRKVCFAELLTLADPPRTVDELRAEVEAIEEDSLLTAGISPHAPYSVPFDEIRGALKLAARLNRPWTIHLAETVEECAFLLGDSANFGPLLSSAMQRAGIESPRMTPAAFLQAIGAADTPRGSAAHMNYAKDADFSLLRDVGVRVIYCPQAHRYFGHTQHPFAALRRALVPTTIGTDSLASNSGASLLSELALARVAAPEISDADALRAITLDAADTLGLAQQIGSIEPGKLADLVAFALDANAADAYSFLRSQPKVPAAVFVEGRELRFA